MEYIIQFIIYVLLINFSFFIYFTIVDIYLPFSPYSPEINRITIGDGKSSKIGIISDFQLQIDHKAPVFKNYENNVYQALKYYKKNEIDILIIAGDTTNNGQIINYLCFKRIFNSVYNNTQKPIVISIMGNHDYLDKNHTVLENQKKFFCLMNSYPYSHYIINNYNFIFWSNDNHHIDYNGITNYSWIQTSLEKARRNIYRNGDPIFVITHMHPLKTVYGSELVWGHKGIYDILKKYPEVICFSGHSHYSLRNIKSIWQGEFTAINTQSLSYVDLDTYFKNLIDVRVESSKNDSMGLLAHLNETSIILDRIQFSNEEIMKEKWEIDFPINPSNFKYKFDLRNTKKKPVFDINSVLKIEKINDKKYFVFSAAKHEDYVYCYKIVLRGIYKVFNKKYLYYSDYYKNEKERTNIVKFKVPKEVSEGKYIIELYAYDSFMNVGEPIKEEIDI